MGGICHRMHTVRLCTNCCTEIEQKKSSHRGRVISSRNAADTASIYYLYEMQLYCSLSLAVQYSPMQSAGRLARCVQQASPSPSPSYLSMTAVEFFPLSAYFESSEAWWRLEQHVAEFLSISFSFLQKKTDNDDNTSGNRPAGR